MLVHQQLEALECVWLVVKRELMDVYLRISYGLYLEDLPKKWDYSKEIKYVISCIQFSRVFVVVVVLYHD